MNPEIRNRSKSLTLAIQFLFVLIVLIFNSKFLLLKKDKKREIQKTFFAMVTTKYPQNASRSKKKFEILSGGKFLVKK